MSLLSKLWDFINRRSTPKVQKSIPHIHEEINLDVFINNDYNMWKESGIPQEISKYVFGQYGLFQAGLTFDQKIEFLDISSKSGIHLKCEEFPYQVEDYKNYMFYLFEKIIDLGYVKNLAEVRSVESGGNILTKYKFYLKPSLYSREDLPNYGRIMLEYVLVNDRSDGFCIISNKHLDARQKEVAPMEEFMNELF